MSSTKTEKPKKSGKTIPHRQKLSRARSEAEQMEQVARAAKAGFKKARKEFRQAKLNAKEARKKLKALSRPSK